MTSSSPSSPDSTGYIRMAAENLRKAQEVSDCGICRELIAGQEQAVGRLSALMAQAEEYAAIQQKIEGELQGMEHGARRSMGNGSKDRDRDRDRRAGGGMGGGFMDMFQNRMRLTDILGIGGRQ